MNKDQKKRMKNAGKKEIDQLSKQVTENLLRENPHPSGSKEWVDRYKELYNQGTGGQSLNERLYEGRPMARLADSSILKVNQSLKGKRICKNQADMKIDLVIDRIISGGDVDASPFNLEIFVVLSGASAKALPPNLSLTLYDQNRANLEPLLHATIVEIHDHILSILKDNGWNNNPTIQFGTIDQIEECR